MRSDKNNKNHKIFKREKAQVENADAAIKTGKKYKFNKRQFLLFAISAIITFIMLGCIYVGIVITQAPKIDTSEIYNILSENSVIYDANGKAVDKIYSDENRINVDYDELPKNLVNAFVALEDKTFWDHNGFNFIRILGAIKDSFTSGSVSGTSTITQQLARNLFLKESKADRTIKRKVIEAYYTTIIEENLSKKQIMEAYLNTIYLGNNTNGVQAAAQAYFSKDVKDLTLEECAALAPLAQAPTEYALVQLLDNSAVTTSTKNILKRTSAGTYVSNDSGKSRRETCLALMLDQKYITQEQYDAAKKVSLSDMLNPNLNNDTTSSSYFTDYVIEQVIDDLMEQKGMDYDSAWEKVYKGGLKIYSTMDSQAQEVIETEFDKESNFPSAININKDKNGNIINKNGAIVLYDYDDYFDKDGVFTFATSEFTKNEDGSVTLKADKRLNVYDTTVQGKTDYSIEFKNMYIMENSKLYSISGGYINIPQKYKTKDKNGDVVISAKFFKDYPDTFIENKDGTLSITADYYSLHQKVIQPQAAMTIVDNKTGQIKAMVGGRQTTGRMLYNRAINPRQPGSSIKPLAVYSAALQQSAEELAAGKKHTFTKYNYDSQGADLYGDYLTAASVVVDEKTVVDGKTWPVNASNSYTGAQTLRTALQQSINTCAFKIFMQVGADYSAQLVKKYGISTLVTSGDTNDMNPAALALGGMTKGVTTLDMASAYTVYPNGGTRKTTTSYTKVENKDGKTILTSEAAESTKVLDQGVAWIMTDLLKSVVSNGLGSPARISGVQAGGKTGTTSDQYDIWFDGFTPNYSASLWIGNDINIELSSYSNMAASLWGKIMNQITNAKSGSYASAPSNVIKSNGEYFISGTQSGVKSVSDYKKKDYVICSESGFLATPTCTHKKTVSYANYGSDSSKIPKYYCNLHNTDTTKYPISPDVTLAPDAGGESTKPEDGSGTGNGSGTGTGETTTP